MKENKIGALICGIVTIVSLVATIIFFNQNHNCYLTNFSFAILGSAILSFIICLINYFVLRNKMILDLLNGIYKYNADTNTQFFPKNNNIDIKDLAIVTSTASYI